MKPSLVRAALVGVLVLGWVVCVWAQEGGKAAGQVPALAPVSVELADATLSDVCEAFSKATGVPFSMGKSNVPATFTMSAKERPFWDVFVELSKKRPLVYRPSMRVRELRLAPMAPAATTGPWQPRRTDYERLNFSAWRMAVAETESGGKAIGSVKGLLKLRVSVSEVTTRLEDVENKHVGETVEIGNARFTLTRVSLRDNRYLNFQYGVEVKGGAGPGGAAADNPPLRIQLQNAAGQTLITDEVRMTAPRRSMTAENAPLVPSAFPFTPPFSVVLRASERMEEMEVPFEMKVGEGSRPGDKETGRPGDREMADVESRRFGRSDLS